MDNLHTIQKTEEEPLTLSEIIDIIKQDPENEKDFLIDFLKINLDNTTADSIF